MATTLYLKTVNECDTTYFSAFEASSTAAAMETSTPTGSNSTTANTTASGTEIRFPLGGNNGWWVSPPIKTAVTLSGTITFNIYASENSMNANVGLRSRVYRLRAGTLTEMGGGPFNDGVELGTSTALMSWTGTVTSNNALIEGDRIVLRLFITNVGTMGGGFTATLSFNGSAGVSDSNVVFTENLDFFDDFEVTHVRFRNDDGSETTATWKAAANTGINLANTASQFRIRLGLKRRTGFFMAGHTWLMTYRKNSGAWTPISTTSSNVRLIASPNINDLADTTQQLTSGTFHPGRLQETSNTVQHINNDTGGGVSTEVESSVDLQDADLAGSDTLEFNFYNNSQSKDAYQPLSVAITVSTGPQTYNVSYPQALATNGVFSSNQRFSNTPVSQGITTNGVFDGGIKYSVAVAQAITAGFTDSAAMRFDQALAQAITAGFTTSSIHRTLMAYSQAVGVNAVFASVHRTLMSVSQLVDVNDTYAAQHRILDAVSQLVDVSDAFQGGQRFQSSVSQSVTMAAVHSAVMRFSQAMAADISVNATYANVLRAAVALAQAVATDYTTDRSVASNNYQVDVSFAITPAMLAAAAHIVRETIIATADVNDAYTVLQRLAGAITQATHVDAAHDPLLRAQGAVSQSTSVNALFNGGNTVLASVSNPIAVNAALAAGMRFSMTVAQAIQTADPYFANLRTTAQVQQALAVGYAVTNRIAALAGVNQNVDVNDLFAGGSKVSASLVEALFPVVTYATTLAAQAGFQASVNVDVFDDFTAQHRMGATIAFPITLTMAGSDIGIEFKQKVNLSVTLVDQVISVNVTIGDIDGWSQEAEANTWTDSTT